MNSFDVFVIKGFTVDENSNLSGSVLEIQNIFFFLIAPQNGKLWLKKLRFLFYDQLTLVQRPVLLSVCCMSIVQYVHNLLRYKNRVGTEDSTGVSSGTGKVLMQGKLIAVSYTLRTYWNQFSLGGFCKQE